MSFYYVCTIYKMIEVAKQLRVLRSYSSIPKQTMPLMDLMIYTQYYVILIGLLSLLLVVY